MLRNNRRGARSAAAWFTALALLVVSLVGLSTTSAAAAGRTARSTTGRLQLCAASDQTHTTKFTVTGWRFRMTTSVQTMAHRTMCGASLSVPKGSYQIRQATPSGARVTSINVTPGKAATARDVASGRAQVAIAAARSTRVTYVNSTISAPPPPPPSSDPGYIEVCKDAGDSYVVGTSVTVTITSGSFTTSQVVPVGQCTGPISVPSGVATVSEVAPFPSHLTSVSTVPVSALVSTDLGSNSAKVTVSPSADSSVETLVHLVNSDALGYVKVCKTLTANSGDIIAAHKATFVFDVSSSISSGTVTVTVPALSQMACALYRTELPLGTVVTVSEESFPNATLTGVQVLPASQDAGSTGSTAMLTVGPNQDGVTTASFTNQADGTVEICKQIDDSNWYTKWANYAEGQYYGSPYDGTPFQFSVNGGAPITVKAGACSAPISVPAGTATIAELSTPNFSLVGFTAVGPDNKSRLVSAGTDNPVTVNVPWGGVGNETLVTATNQVNTGRVKVCKVLDDKTPVGKSYDFVTRFSVGDGWYDSDVTLTPTANGPSGEVCGWLSAPLPVVNPDGSSVSVKVTEGPSPFGVDTNGKPIVEPTMITYQGNGSFIESLSYAATSSPGPVATAPDADGCYHLSAYIGQGVNVITFTNSLVLDP